MSETMPGTTGFVPSDAEVASVLAWFERYDALAAALDYEGMAELAVFPLNEVTDDGKGQGKAEQLDRSAYLAQMEQVMGGGGDVKLETTRTPHFLSASLVFVISDGTMTYDGFTQPIRYGDLLLKVDGNWKFQTMVQGGWG
ncbi:nuclear transport factor 2 family protein [Kribbella caucasensis]|nr:nuclear transport factor 2 family protein [Kribbella sp. VKM Ac-2527]